MATFNPKPRGLIISPYNEANIHYYFAVMDFPNSMCTKNPVGTHVTSTNTVYDPASKVLTFKLEKGITFPPDFDNGDYAEFTTFILPMYTKSPDTNSPGIEVKTEIVVEDDLGIKKHSGQSGSLHVVSLFEHTNRLAVMKESATEPYPLYQFRPFVIKNLSNISPRYFVGGLMRFSPADNPTWQLVSSTVNSSINTSDILVAAATGPDNNPELGNQEYATLLAAFNSYNHRYNTIQLEGNTEPDNIGYFINTDKDIDLYANPTAEI